MRSRHKNTKHLMILAFFNVVASRQISPHVSFRAAKIDIFFDMQIFKQKVLIIIG